MKKVLEYTVFVVIRFYKLCISPYFPPSCRHVPTCSAYMEEAIQEWGVAKGVYMGLMRLCKCHPWGTHGYDPVPKKEKNGRDEQLCSHRT
ncbi:membrane protein insertion efficiency factor YidD [Fulvivirgaceae bacterium BMA12]|uniref:Putative membrane protein insertion efficiency factor n=1 Tax=Agaribacillus aureus TaxID=3051825 RepID=A0ABT8L4W5_9BACT|nr:membrane protein insertion efficiency factor YidD [Fulvivirgaceae bacterium BMA12]